VRSRRDRARQGRREDVLSEPGIKLTTYFGERERVGRRFLADALFDAYERHRMRTSILLRGIEGFGGRHRLQTDRLLSLSESLPVVSIAVDTRARIEAAVPDVLELAGHGLTTLERARLATGDALTALALPDHPGRALKLTVYGGRSVRSDSDAGYVAAVDLLRSSGAAGASVLLGVDGTLHGERRRARFFARNAGVPLMLVAIGSRTSLEPALPELSRLLGDAVVTVERVQICKSAGQLLAKPHPAAERDPSGLPIWQKLMVHVEEQAKSDGHPLHVELVRRLLAAGAAGATVLRGVRGFYGDREPFADTLLSLRRNVPVLVVAIDRPANVRRWWPVVDHATREAGLVTSELVPASHGLSSGTRPSLSLASTPTSEPD
jgi:PII-like signaling protein